MDDNKLSPGGAAFLPPAFILFYFPSLIYQGNSAFVETPFAYLLLFILPFYGATSLLLLLLGRAFPQRARIIYHSILVAFSLILWVIGNFLFGYRGLLDGRDFLKLKRISRSGGANASAFP